MITHTTKQELIENYARLAKRISAFGLEIGKDMPEDTEVCVCVVYGLNTNFEKEKDIFLRMRKGETVTYLVNGKPKKREMTYGYGKYLGTTKEGIFLIYDIRFIQTTRPNRVDYGQFNKYWVNKLGAWAMKADKWIKEKVTFS